MCIKVGETLTKVIKQPVPIVEIAIVAVEKDQRPRQFAWVGCEMPQFILCHILFLSVSDAANYQGTNDADTTNYEENITVLNIKGWSGG